MDDFISTVSVPKFHFLNPVAEEIHIFDIAHALSLTCRFGGHSSVFYSVAEHSIILASILESAKAEPLTLLAALLHDAEEAYFPDIPTPIRAQMPEAKAMYEELRAVILNKFNLWEADWARVEAVDRRLCITEAKALGLWNEDWENAGQSLDVRLHLWSSTDAEQLFLNNFQQLQ